MTVGRSLAAVYSSDCRPAGTNAGTTGTAPAGMSFVGGVPWVDEDAPPDRHCVAFKDSGDRCTAYKTKDSDWCAGHVRRYGVAVEAGE